jgi:hypothetical protein
MKYIYLIIILAINLLAAHSVIVYAYENRFAGDQLQYIVVMLSYMGCILCQIYIASLVDQSHENA